MTPQDLAAIYKAAFVDSRSWTADEFATLLASPHCFAVHGKGGFAQGGFALGRVIADEAELLTIATSPRVQRTGVAAHCLRAFQSQAAARGAVSAFLEVADDNTAAIALYESQGWSTSGRRQGYYARNDGSRVDARLLMRKLP